MDKYIGKALKTLGIKLSDTQEFELNTMKDLDGFINRHKDQLSELEICMEELKEAIEQVKNELDLLNDLKHQVKVEEYKELNKDFNVEVF